MRAGMAVILGLLTALLAGCMDESSPDNPAAPTTFLETRAWEFTDSLHPDGGCPIGAACFGGGPAGGHEFRVAANERIAAFAIRIEHAGDLLPAEDSARPLNLKVSCRTVDALPCGPNATLEERMPLPALLAADRLDWPYGAGLYLEFERDVDFVAFWHDLFTSGVRVDGNLVVEVDPALPVPVLETAVAPFRFDTTTTCVVVVDPQCATMPGRLLDLPTDGQPVHVYGLATWDALHPAAAIMRFELRCYDDEAGGCESYVPVFAEGPSPLAFDFDLRAAGIHGTPRLVIDITEELVPAGPYPVPVTTYQPFILEGEVHGLVPDDGAEGRVARGG